MMFKKLSITLSLLMASYVVFAAKPYVVEAKCPVQIIAPDKAPKKLPEYFSGIAKNNSEELACKEAKKIATSKFPQGTKPKHCRCITQK